MRYLFLMFSLILSSTTFSQTVSFQSIFTSNMVLPHNQPVSLSGYAQPNTELTMEVDDTNYSFSSNSDGQWQVEISPLKAGGPYALHLSDANGASTTLNNILAGEIWVCSGQSNMAYSVAASIDQPEHYNQGHSGIRLLSVPLVAELDSLDNFKEAPQWQRASTDSVSSFSAICYFFARKRIEQNGIPLGLINASWGGSAIEAWISEQGLSSVPSYSHKVEQLQQFRTDRRGAELSFAEDWEVWWQGASNDGPVWQQGVLNERKDWRNAPMQSWKTYPDERLQNHHGIVWFSTQFELTSQQQQKGASLVLGRIDEVDTTWVNGQFVNNTFGYGTRREYKLEPGVLKSGVNQITVNVINTWAAGGMMGPVAEVGIRFDDGEFVALGDRWKYSFIPKSVGYPPRSPWESVSGIAGMFNGMIAPLKPLKPAGVIWYQGESNADSPGSYRFLLESLISDWREHFDSPALPFVVIQLPNYGVESMPPANPVVSSGWSRLRQIQQQVAISDQLVGIVVTHDVGDNVDIHPKRKWVVGMRTADVVKAIEGGGVANGVEVLITDRSSQMTGTLMLEFNPPLAAISDERDVQGFSLCANDESSCVWVKAIQQGSFIEVDISSLTKMGSLRYCWTDGGQCELRALNGLPVSSFRIGLSGSVSNQE